MRARFRLRGRLKSTTYFVAITQTLLRHTSSTRNDSPPCNANPLDERRGVDEDPLDERRGVDEELFRFTDRRRTFPYIGGKRRGRQQSLSPRDEPLRFSNNTSVLEIASELDKSHSVIKVHFKSESKKNLFKL